MRKALLPPHKPLTKKRQMNLPKLIIYQQNRIRMDPSPENRAILEHLLILKNTYSGSKNSVLVEMPEKDFPTWLEFKEFKKFKSKNNGTTAHINRNHPDYQRAFRHSISVLRYNASALVTAKISQ